MFARYFVIGAAAVLWAAAATAQTHGQRLERAIFTEDTAGDLDAAIRMYEQLVSAPGVPPEIAARAQSRLSGSRQRRQQTQLALASAAEQARGLPGRIDPPLETPRPAPATAEPKPRYEDMYDASRPVSVVGFVTQVQWSNPNVVVYLQDADGKPWGFVLGPPDNLVRSGWDRNTIKLGEKLQAQGTLAKGVGANCPGPLPNGCATFLNGAIHVNARQLLRVDADGNVTRPNAGQPDAPAGGRGGRGGRGGGAQ